MGHAIVVDGVPFLVTACQHSKQARGAGVLKTTLKNLKTGATVPRTFQGNEKLAPADVGFRKCQFLYKNADSFEFMRSDDFENCSVAMEVAGDNADFLVEGEEYDLRFFGEEVISVEVPPSMAFEVVETPPGVKGDTATGGTKPAKLSNGITVLVPLYIAEGERIAIRTDTREFQKRAAS